MYILFEVGQKVVYGACGACEITAITEKKIGKDTYSYYCLRSLINENNCVFVPINNDSLVSKMQKILNFEELCSLLEASFKEDPLWIDDDKQRKDSFRLILSSGNRMDIIKMTKGISNQEQLRKAAGKKLRSSDEIFFKKAQNYLFGEFSNAINLKQNQVIPLLFGKIRLEEIN